jgi:N-acetylglucosamine-6-sulfatase
MCPRLCVRGPPVKGGGTTGPPVRTLILALGLLSATVIALSGHGLGTRTAAAGAVQRPNIVFVLTDDLDWSLVTAQYMPHVVALERSGETFDHYIVADSLCCPSRSSIFTGLFPHDTGVYTNTGADGGYYAFTHHKPNLETRTFAVAMQHAGYLTSMMGKYLNGYGEPAMTTQVPRGWNDWHVAGNAYPEFNYDLNENGAVVHYGPGPPPAARAANYLTDVLAARALTFINRAAAARKPFMLEIATFAPHRPYTAAPRNRHDFPGLGAPRDPSFNTANTNPPDWLGNRKKLTPAQVAKIDDEYRMRAQSVEAVDRLLGLVEATLSARGLANNTYIVFSSDNGYHMGQHRLLPGKETAFDTDIRVPLIIAGPGVPRGQVVSHVVQNVDLYPTFVQLVGRTRVGAVDGQSLLPLLHPAAGAAVAWPTVALIEHHGPSDVHDPDFENGELGGNPSAYEAIRISNRQLGNAVYVEYEKTGRREYYNIDQDPFERENTYKLLIASTRAWLHKTLMGLERCHNAAACSAAADPQVG